MEDVEASAKLVIEKSQKQEAAPVIATAVAIEGAPVQAAVSAAGAPGKLTLSKDVVKSKVLELAGSAVADGEGVEQDVPFMEAGIDSLGSVQFVTDVSRAFSLQLPPSAIFDYPTGRALIDHIIEESS